MRRSKFLGSLASRPEVATGEAATLIVGEANALIQAINLREQPADIMLAALARVSATVIFEINRGASIQDVSADAAAFSELVVANLDVMSKHEAKRDG